MKTVRLPDLGCLGQNIIVGGTKLCTVSCLIEKLVLFLINVSNVP